MTQAQAVIETIDKLGGIATLNQINQHIFEIEECVEVRLHNTSLSVTTSNSFKLIYASISSFSSSNSSMAA